MSFSKQVKEELLEQKIEDDDIALAFLSGIVRSIGKIETLKEQTNVYVVTDVALLYDYCNSILKMLYGDYAELEIAEKAVINKTLYYNIKFPQHSAFQILQDIGIAKLSSQGYELTNEVDTHILKNENCVKAYIKAVFLACSTNSIKISDKPSEKSNSGYHLEFTSHDKDFLTEFSAILASQNIFARLVERKNIFVLYIKDASSISDLLALIGAENSVLTLQNEIVAREMRNSVNRQINCFSANIEKTVSANLKQLEAIEIINTTIGIESLNEELQEVALLRLANTEESLQDLVKLSGLTLTKSGINHRMKKIMKIAEGLKD